MNKSFKIQIFPNKEQRELIFKSFGCARFAYNWALNEEIENYKNGSKFISDCDLRKKFTQFKKTLPWLKEVNNNVTKQAIKDLCRAYKNFFDKKADFPKFKSKHKSKPSFYNDTAKIKFDDGKKVRLETIGWMKIADKKNIIPKNTQKNTQNNTQKYLNPRISFDGINFWLSIGCVLENKQNQNPQTEPIGIDLGIKTLMVCSNKMEVKRVKTKKENKKLKRLQRRASKFYLLMKAKLIERSKNLLKLENQVRKQYHRITNVRKNNIHQTTTKLVKLNPKAIVIEDLNVKGMMKNKHLSKAIADCSFYEIRRQLEYKCEWNGINLIIADRWFPSSKTCSHCGYKKPKLSLSERMFKCECCNYEIDRDYNASINLRNLAYS